MADYFDNLVAAITRQENSASNPTTAPNNNPGNLVYSSWEQTYGAVQGAGGFAAFPDVAQGTLALQDRLSQLINGGASLTGIVNTWAGPQYPGNTQASADSYVNALAGATGLNPTQSVASQTATGTVQPGAGTIQGQAQAATQGIISGISGSSWLSGLQAALNPVNVATLFVGMAFLAIGGFMLAARGFAAAANSETGKTAATVARTVAAL